jgi:predicted nuclease of predicted toxin-antitoxin system
VKFVVDAQLPARLALLLNRAGHEAIHISDLPDGNASTDAQVVEIADAQDRVVVTKDRDLRDGHLLTGSPTKLFIVATGNIGPGQS